MTQDCLNSLYFPELHARRDLVADAYEDTYNWIWSHPSYVAWKAEKSSILWIQGKPGSGKSTLAKKVSQKLKETPITGVQQAQEMHNERKTQSVMADYFYSARGGALETSHKLMLKSLLYQILKQAPSLYSSGSRLSLVFRAVRDRQPGHIEWTYSDLEKALYLLADSEYLLNNEAFVFYFLVDAVDESEDVAERGRQRSDILRILRKLATADGLGYEIKNFKIILISRPANAIERQLRGCHYIEVEKENRSDINKIIDLGLKALWAIMEPGDEDYDLDTEEDEKNPRNVMNKL